MYAWSPPVQNHLPTPMFDGNKLGDSSSTTSHGPVVLSLPVRYGLFTVMVAMEGYSKHRLPWIYDGNRRRIVQ